MSAESIFPFDDTQDFEDTHRGFIASVSPGTITNDRGEVVWDCDSYDFIAGEAPPTVHPSLWRQSKLVAKHGLFKVLDSIYQVRGFDLSNITFVEGDTGIIIIDPLISTETAAAALKLYREHRGDRPVIAVIYTHCHVDHFGGVKGVTTQADVDAGRVQIIAPAGFLEPAIAENLYVGTAMARRAGYMYGAALPRTPHGSVGAGLGQTTSTGTVTLIPPTVDITETGQELTIDGVRIVFQLAPGTEAPAEMHFHFPDHRALCIAENATHTLHNILTLRGAVVRDAHIWAHYLGEAIEMFGDHTDVVFASHHWPTWDHDRAVGFLAAQRDLYGYLHDQTVRMINKGYTGTEIADRIEMPPALDKMWSTHGYYGSLSHNVKAIYQRYMGWYDGNPARLWRHAPAEAAKRYVDFMGGADAVVAKARKSKEDGDLRWTAEVLDHVIFAQPNHTAGRALFAETLEALGLGSENGTWRNVYLSAATELRNGNLGTPTASSPTDVLAVLAPEMFFDAVAIQIDGPRAWDLNVSLRWVFPDHGTVLRTRLRNGVFSHNADSPGPVDATLTVPRAALAALAMADLPRAQSAGLTIDGDLTALSRIFGVLDPGDPAFEIIVP
ncbi:alkyl/aryl-sulfatase [Gordonia sp. CPCC 205333]|uniref:alkyl/aryl-sulfatase n=1 Tax=Gordonia sp. CPCC 205333 TaxID=3140790 RepID=UPI003AF39CA3